MCHHHWQCRRQYPIGGDEKFLFPGTGRLMAERNIEHYGIVCGYNRRDGTTKSQPTK